MSHSRLLFRWLNRPSQFEQPSGYNCHVENIWEGPNCWCSVNEADVIMIKSIYLRLLRFRAYWSYVLAMLLKRSSSGKLGHLLVFSLVLPFRALQFLHLGPIGFKFTDLYSKAQWAIFTSPRCFIEPAADIERKTPFLGGFKFLILTSIETFEKLPFQNFPPMAPRIKFERWKVLLP